MDALADQLQATLGGAYTLSRELGGGGMSRVFVARDLTLGRDIVVKVLHPELATGLSAERFTREIKLAASLQQANIVPLLSAGEFAGLPYYTMPFVEGLSLRDRLRRDGKLTVTETISILRDVARALDYAHARGVVHRDIKPENILLSGGAAVVTDFGTAKALASSETRSPGDTLTQLGTSVGTPAYMAPGQAPATPQLIIAPMCTRWEASRTNSSPGPRRSPTGGRISCSSRMRPRPRRRSPVGAPAYHPRSHNSSTDVWPRIRTSARRRRAQCSPRSMASLAARRRPTLPRRSEAAAISSCSQLVCSPSPPPACSVAGPFARAAPP